MAWRKAFSMTGSAMLRFCSTARKGVSLWQNDSENTSERPCLCLTAMFVKSLFGSLTALAFGKPLTTSDFLRSAREAEGT